MTDREQQLLDEVMRAALHDPTLAACLEMQRRGASLVEVLCMAAVELAKQNARLTRDLQRERESSVPPMRQVELPIVGHTSEGLRVARTPDGLQRVLPPEHPGAVTMMLRRGEK